MGQLCQLNNWGKSLLIWEGRSGPSCGSRIGVHHHFQPPLSLICHLSCTITALFHHLHGLTCSGRSLFIHPDSGDHSSLLTCSLAVNVGGGCFVTAIKQSLWCNCAIYQNPVSLCNIGAYNGEISEIVWPHTMATKIDVPHWAASHSFCLETKLYLSCP